MQIKLGTNNKDILIEFPYNEEVLEVIHRLPSREYDKKNKVWKIPTLDLPIFRDEIAPLSKKANITFSLHPQAEKLYIEILKSFKLSSEIAKKNSSDFSIVGLKDDVKLYDFQDVGAEFLYNIKRGLMAFDMGLGKTICSLASASKLIQENKIKKTLIICPSSLKYNWALEISKFTNYFYTVIGGDKEERENLYFNNSHFTIMNYDLLRLDIKKILEIPWDLIIADEVQRVKNYTTAIHKNIRKLNAEYIFALTGTPIENSIMELFTIMRFINPKIFGNNALYFRDRYCETDRFHKVVGYKNLSEIDRKLSFVMIRRKKREVLEELPEKIVNNYYITLSKEERKMYDEYKKGIVADIKSGAVKFIDILARVTYLREACDCINLLQPIMGKICSSKLEELNRILKDIPFESKIVIFTEYERMAKIIEENIPYKSVHLHGGVKNDCKFEKEIEKKVKKENPELKGQELDLKIHEEKQSHACSSCPYYNDSECWTRKKLTDKFTNDKSVKVMISTSAGKEGNNWQAANFLIHYDKSFNPAVNEQREARIERIGQKHEKIFVINLICENTIEEKLLNILEQKKEIFDRLIDRSDLAPLKNIDGKTLLSIL